MKKTLHIISVLAAALLAAACESEIRPDEDGFVGESTLCFQPALNGSDGTKAGGVNGLMAGSCPVSRTKVSELVSSDGSISVPLTCTISDSSAPQTKGEQQNTTGEIGDLGTYTDKFYVSAWKGSKSFVPAYELVTKGEPVWTTSTSYKWGASSSATFYAYANLPESGAEVKNATAALQSLDYTIPSDASEQNDILLGFYKGNARYDATLHRGGIADIKFYHPLAAVQFKIMPGAVTGATNVTVKKIRIKGVYAGGTCIMTPPGTGATDPALRWAHGGTTTVELGDGISEMTPDSDKGYLIGEPFILIPQDLSTDPVSITVVLNVDGTETTLAAKIDSGGWEAGKTDTYCLSISESVSNS